MRFPVPQAILDALSQLNRRGHEAYLVGGCVRDDMLGIPPRDYDICTAALPDEVRACFPGGRISVAGIRFGTVTVSLGGLPTEITTFRADGSYSDGRHPDSVVFTKSLREDLLRRDFTFNAMAWHPDKGLIDYAGGARDCLRRTVVAVGDPFERLSQDALRILRALRFSSVLGFAVSDDLAGAMNALSAKLRSVSRERIAGELNLLLAGARAGDAMRACPRAVIEAVPELGPLYQRPPAPAAEAQGLPSCRGLWDHTLRVVSGTSAQLDVRWAALLHETGKAQAFPGTPGSPAHGRGSLSASAGLAAGCLRRLRQPKALTDSVVRLIAHLEEEISEKNLRLWLSRLGLPFLRKLLELRRADLAADNPGDASCAEAVDRLLLAAEEMTGSGCCLSLKDLAVNGRLLLSHGFPPDAFLGETLRDLLALVLEGRARNEEAALLSIAAQRLAGRGQDPGAGGDPRTPET